MFKTGLRAHHLLSGVTSMLDERYHVERIECENRYDRQSIAFKFARGRRSQVIEVKDTMNEREYYQSIGDQSRLAASKLNIWPNLLIAE